MRFWSRTCQFFVLLAACLVASPSRCAEVLMIVDVGGSYNAQESARKSQLETWGHTVTNVGDSASQATIDAAVASADVVYVPATITDWELLYKLRTATKGVVTETPGLDQEFGFATADGYTQSWNSIDNVNNSHSVTAGVASGTLVIVTSNQNLALNGNTVAAGMQLLATLNFGGLALGVIDTGGALADTYSGNSTATARRVRLPWNTITFSALNSNGLSILQNAIAWAAGNVNTLQLHLKLNEASGTAAADSSGYGRNGTVTGTATWIAGRRHNAFDFNGSTKIEVNSLLGSPTSFSLACWARIDATDSSGAEGVSVGDYILLRPHDVTNGAAMAFFYYGGGNFRSVAATSSFVGRGWHHFVATFDDSANSFKLYIDGALVATTSTTSSVSWSGLGTKTRVGAHGNTNTNLDMDGAIDDVRVYNKALSQSEVADVYGLVGHWKLDETSGTAATDSSGKALNGTHTNGPTVGQAGPYPGAGQYAASFDGSNDYVNGATATNYTFADGFSIAGWINLDTFVASAAILQNGATTQNCELAISGTGQVSVAGRSAGGVQTLTTTTTLQCGKWKHVVGTYDGTTFKVYIDGALDSSASNSFTVSAAPSGNLTLASSLEGTDQYLDGKLHDVRLYNRALAAEEVGELYGLVGQWKINETSGTVADDASPIANDGAYANSPSLGQAGPYPGAGLYATQFDGTNDHVALGNIGLNLSKGFTMAAWVRSTSAASNSRILEVGGGSGVSNIVFARSGTTSDLRLNLNDGSSGDTALTASGCLELNEWHHYVATCDSSGNGKIFCDGQQVASGAMGTPSNVLRNVNYIARSSSGGDAYYQGRLFDVRLYNRPLSTREVAELYGLVGYWKFDEGSGVNLAESSGVGASAAFNSGAPAWISGTYSSGLSFNGTTDGAITSAVYAPPSMGTVAYWFRSTGTPAAQQRHFGLGGDWEAWQNPDGIIRFDLCGDGEIGGFKTTSTPMTSSSWYHFAAMYDAADDSYAVYINGVLEKSGVSTAALSPQAAGQLSFGTRTGTTNRLAGSLDDFRIYNRKLSAWEVYQVYGLMGWYKMDETAGAVATDSTGRGQDGAFSGSPTLNVTANGAATQGTAVAFNGTNYMQATGLYERSTSVSAAAWVRLDGVDSSGADVISLGDHFKLSLRTGATGGLAAYYNGSTWITATTSQVILNTGWHHFAAVLRDGDSIKFYVDGVEAASTSASGTISYSGLGSSTMIAKHGNSSSAYDFTGRIDDVRVFNRDLKPDEVFQLYRGSRINGIKILTWVETR